MEYYENFLNNKNLKEKKSYLNEFKKKTKYLDGYKKMKEEQEKKNKKMNLEEVKQ